MASFVAPGVTAALCLALAMGGCSADNPTSSDGGTDSGGTSCQGPMTKTARGSLAVSQASASFVDANSKSVPGVFTMVVGLDLASPPATSDASGAVQINFAHTLRAPLFRYGDGVKFPVLGIPMDTGMGMVGFVGLPLTAMPTQGIALAAGATLTSGDLTLTTAAGTTILIDTLSYSTPNDQQLRAASQPLGAKLYLDTHNLGLELIVGAGPYLTSFCPPARLTLANRPAWPAGTAVELFTLGLDVGEDFAPYGEWLSLGEGTVSSDGKSLVFGPLVKALGPFGVRKKP